MGKFTHREWLDCSSMSEGILEKEQEVKVGMCELYVGHSGNIYKPHGMIILDTKWEGVEVYIDYLVASPESLRCPSNERKDREFRHVGHQLMQHIEQLAFNAGANKVALAPLKGAERFYTNEGYTPEEHWNSESIWSKIISNNILGKRRA